MIKTEKNVKIHYLGHSAFAAETEGRLLVFDCAEESRTYLEKIPALKTAQLYFFSSHSHHDHYDGTPEFIAAKYPSVVHFTGWKSRMPGNINVRPHESISAYGLTVTALKSNDDGAAFVVKGDNVTLFHGGDLAGWEDETWLSFQSEIDFLANAKLEVDIAFLAVTTFSGVLQKSMAQAAAYFMEKIKPDIFIPMHANGQEHLFKEFKTINFPDDNRVLCPSKPGDVFDLTL